MLRELRYLGSAATPIAVSCFALSDIGLKKDAQEDAFTLKEIFYKKFNVKVIAMIVADGIGTPPAGELFAETAVTKFWETLRFSLPYAEQQDAFDRFNFIQALNDKVAAAIFPAAQSANSRVIDIQNAKNIQGGGCTLAVAIMICDLEKGSINIHGYHEGDSPIFFTQSDATVEMSRTTEHHVGGALLCFIGNSSHSSGKLFSKEVWMGDQGVEEFAICVCTDGLSNMLSEEELSELFTANQTANEFCNAAMQLSLTTTNPAARATNEKITTANDNITLATAIVRRKN